MKTEKRKSETLKFSAGRLVISLAALALAGCASTEVLENGQPIMKMQADATNVTLQTDHTYFHADVLIHSTPTLAGGQAATQVIGGVAGLAGTIGTAVVAGGVAHALPVTALAATALPATAGNLQGLVRPTNINITNPPEQVVTPGQRIIIQTAQGSQVYTVARTHRHRRHRASPTPTPKPK